MIFLESMELYGKLECKFLFIIYFVVMYLYKLSKIYIILVVIQLKLEGQLLLYMKIFLMQRMHVIILVVLMFVIDT
jgi:hypothetical protein